MMSWRADLVFMVVGHWKWNATFAGAWLHFDGEYRSLWLVVCQTDDSSVRFNDLADDVQPQAGTRGLPGFFIADPVKFFEYSNI